MLCLGGCLEAADEDTDTSITQESFGGDLGNVVGTFIASNTTVGGTNQHQPTCATSTAPDMSYSWTAPSTGSFTFTTTPTPPTGSFDTILQVRDFTSGASLGCNDDSAGTALSTVAVNLTIGQTVRIVVDGFASGSGPFRLSILGAGGATGRNYACGYALPGFGCNNGKASTSLLAADMTAAVAACRIAQPANLPDFCHVRDRDGFAASNQAQCIAAAGSWRPLNNCCNFRGSTSCP
jgi:hypothetical protein